MDRNADRLTEEISELAIGAGKKILQAEDIKEKTHIKGGHWNVVTEYDQANQEFLFSKLKEVLPEANFVGEEEGSDGFREEYRSGYAFVIDPIDGTTNFVKSYRPSMISIGLLKDGRPYIGVIYNPYADELFCAVKGQGSRMNGKQISTTSEPLSDSLVSFGTSPYRNELIGPSMQLAEGYLRKCADLRRSGTAAFDLTNVARGVTGLFFELSLGLWDFAAGALIVTEAGGTVTDAYGNALTYDGHSSVIASGAGIRKSDILYLKK